MKNTAIVKKHGKHGFRVFVIFYCPYLSLRVPHAVARQFTLDHENAYKTSAYRYIRNYVIHVQLFEDHSNCK